MRPVPGRRRGLRRALAALLVVGALASGAVNRPRPGPLVRVRGPLDAPRALVVYHPGPGGAVPLGAAGQHVEPPGFRSSWF